MVSLAPSATRAPARGPAPGLVAQLRGRIPLRGIERLLPGREVKRSLTLDADELLVLILHNPHVNLTARRSSTAARRLLRARFDKPPCSELNL